MIEVATAKLQAETKKSAKIRDGYEQRKQKKLEDHQSIQEVSLVKAAIDDSTLKVGGFLNDLIIIIKILKIIILIIITLIMINNNDNDNKYKNKNSMTFSHCLALQFTAARYN